MPKTIFGRNKIWAQKIGWYCSRMPPHVVTDLRMFRHL